MIYELFPPDQRGTALGIWGIAAMAAPAIGPVLGGYLVTSVSWRWLFLINVPIGVIGVVVGVRLLRDAGYREQRRFDAHRSRSRRYRPRRAPLSGSRRRAGGAGHRRLRWRFSLSVPAPAVAPSSLQERAWTNRSSICTCSAPDVLPDDGHRLALTVMQFARLVFIPLELQTVRHLTALKVGLLLTPAALGVAATMPIGGRLADQWASLPRGARQLDHLGTAWFWRTRPTPRRCRSIVALLSSRVWAPGLR